MRVRMSRKVAVASTLSLATLLYGAKAAAFLGPGDALLAEILANTSKQLTVMIQSLSELRKSYGEVKRVAEYADDAATAARSFRQFSGRRFGDRFQADLDAAYPDLAVLRQDALAASGMGGSPWAQGTGTLQRLSSYCLADIAGGNPACVQLRSELESSKVLNALAATFGARSGAAQALAVDAEVAATIRAASAQDRAADLQKARLRELLRRCNGAAGDGGFGGTHEAKRFAEECQLAAQQAQLLQLEEGQETNVKLAEIARLQAIAIEQKNAELKRELAEQEARRTALTGGLEALASERITIRSGGLQP
jgi:hypothetical protein